jgi:hypothetical protein
MLSYILGNKGTYGPLPNNTTITVQMRHDLRDKLTDYWATSDELCMPFYSNAMKRDRYCHILRFLHFTDKNETDRKDKILTDWKIRNLFEIPNRTFSKFYNLCQHVAVYEVIGLYKERVVFRQYIPPVRPGRSEQLHSPFLMWGKENFA